MAGRIRDWLGRLPPERAVLAFGILVGLASTVGIYQQHGPSKEIDFHAYYVTGRAVIQGEPFVGWAITEGSFLTEKAYVYTPVTAPVFSLYGLYPEWYVPYVVNGAVLLGTFYLIGRITTRYIEANGRDLERIDRWLIVGFCLFSLPAVLGLYRGNIDPVILLAIVVGFLAIERGREATGGALWALAALFKLFPAFLGVWLLYRRAYRGIAAALAVGIGGILLGIAIFGVDAHVEFVEFIVHERSREGAFVGGLDPSLQWITLRRPLSYLFALSGNYLMLLSFLLLAPFLAVMYWYAESDLDGLVVFFATFVALLITIIPSTAGYVVYVLFPLIALAYLVEHRVVKYCFLVGLVAINLPIFPHHVQRFLEAIPFSGTVISVVSDVVWTLMTYASVGLWGFLVIFAGCLVYVWTSRSERVSAVSAD